MVKNVFFGPDEGKPVHLDSFPKINILYTMGHTKALRA